MLTLAGLEFMAKEVLTPKVWVHYFIPLGVIEKENLPSRKLVRPSVYWNKDKSPLIEGSFKALV